ncbi:MAG: hypothetical protein IJ094_12885 [Bacilli bacterium]|nr:hypothetical protein [Bacilli bacterium]
MIYLIFPIVMDRRYGKRYYIDSRDWLDPNKKEIVLSPSRKYALSFMDFEKARLFIKNISKKVDSNGYEFQLYTPIPERSYNGLFK